MKRNISAMDDGGKIPRNPPMTMRPRLSSSHITSASSLNRDTSHTSTNSLMVSRPSGSSNDVIRSAVVIAGSNTPGQAETSAESVATVMSTTPAILALPPCKKLKSINSGSTNTLSFPIMSAVGLGDLIASAIQMSYLLVDCRDSESFHLSRIQFSVNAPLSANNEPDIVSYNSPPGVLKFMIEQCPTLLESINAPGFYKEIILFDKSSAPERLPDSLSALFTSITKWNEDTRTKVYLLQGGYQQFAMSYACRLTNDNINPEPFAIPIAPAEASQQILQLFQNFEEYNNHLDTANDVTKCLVYLRRKLNSLEAVKLVLANHQQMEMIKNSATLIPEDVKCPICFEIFSAEIYQCGNGHSVCSVCVASLTTCPVCRLAYGKGANGKIRNRALERLLTTTFRIDCPYSATGCSDKVTYFGLAGHAKVCVGLGGKEMERIEEHEKSTSQEITAALNKLNVMNRNIWEVERSWNKMALRSVRSDIPKPVLERMSSRIEFLNETKSVLLSEMVSNKDDFSEKNSVFY